ncbi:hypothetical protein BM536_002855 [Streptomyces phaeoluteigriseus]|uniref:Transposase IS4-like domain-containing protein n=1 Tax=Streptomyces phaeoluteigriseus TaxID=114686 RepID=A0A1V6MYT9_9ACTN|nr:hypothetical protein BM536_002855 [Streptomyces phaeoluteigriseus]
MGVHSWLHVRGRTRADLETICKTAPGRWKSADSLHALYSRLPPPNSASLSTSWTQARDTRSKKGHLPKPGAKAGRGRAEGAGPGRSFFSRSVCRGSQTPASFQAAMGEFRYLVEQTFTLLHYVKRLAVRLGRHTELHDVFVPWPAASSAGDVSKGPQHPVRECLPTVSMVSSSTRRRSRCRDIGRAGAGIVHGSSAERAVAPSRC